MRETSTGETAAFVSNVVLDGAVENWLVELEHAMKKSMQQLLAVSIQAHRGKDKEKWITDVQGQLLITTGSIQWTNDCSKALGSISNGKKNALRQLKKKQVAYLTRLTDMIRGQLPRLVRTKLVALITMEIHNRDVMERMIKAGCSSVTDFDWLCQLRFLFNKEEGQFGGICTVRQTNCNLDYGYEYQGNNGRLVVTPLTDRCVLTLLTAKFLNRGGNPLGPAGTGKTETVKDLSKNLAMYCVVINCSDGREPESIQKAYWGSNNDVFVYTCLTYTQAWTLSRSVVYFLAYARLGLGGASTSQPRVERIVQGAFNIYLCGFTHLSVWPFGQRVFTEKGGGVVVEMQSQPQWGIHQVQQNKN